MTMVIATHEMAFAREIAGQVCFLDDGVILEQGPPEQIFASPAQPRTRQFLDRIIRAGSPVGERIVCRVAVEHQHIDVSIEPLDEYLVIQPSNDETETRVRADPPRLGGVSRRRADGDRDGRRARTRAASSPATRCSTRARKASTSASAASR